MKLITSQKSITSFRCHQKCVSEESLDLTKITFSGLDGTNFMSGEVGGLQALIRKVTTFYVNSSVMRQKGEYQNGFFKKTKGAKFSKKGAFLTP